jgi:hypothetical protein
MSTPPKPSQPPEPPEQQSLAPPGAYAYPPSGGPTYAGPGPYGPYPPAATGRPPGGGGAGRAVLWAAAGAVLASAAWAVAVFALDAGKDGADLGGYTAAANLCGKADHSSFDDTYPGDDNASHQLLRDSALETSYCGLSLRKSTSTLADAYLTLQMDLHKETDPGPEFRALWKNYDDLHDGYDVDTVDGIGDEAYLVSQDTSGDSTTGSRYATLAVRDGWMTWTMTYSNYFTSYGSDKDAPELDEVTDWMKADTESTLEALRG